jgi:hypothetical protein
LPWAWGGVTVLLRYTQIESGKSQIRNDTRVPPRHRSRVVVARRTRAVQSAQPPC